MGERKEGNKKENRVKRGKGKGQGKCGVEETKMKGKGKRVVKRRGGKCKSWGKRKKGKEKERVIKSNEIRNEYQQGV